MRVLLAVILVLLLPLQGRSQTPEQHKKILDSAALEVRSNEISERIIWKQSDLISSCRKNFERKSCDGTAYQYVQGPILRAENRYGIDAPFLSNTLANRLSSAANVSLWNNVHEYCDTHAVDALIQWVKSNENVKLDEYVYMTYLSSDDPWFYCFSKDSRAAVASIESTGSFELEHHEFWLWRGGRVVGEIECGTPYNRFGASKVFPQCTLNLNFSNGNVRMTISPLPAVNIRQIVLSLSPITHTFWKRAQLDVQEYDIDPKAFFVAPIISVDAEQIMTKIERYTE